jgi:hypothetical protein
MNRLADTVSASPPGQGEFVFDAEESRLQRRYREWRLTPNGEAVFGMVEQAALAKAALGESFGIASLAEELQHDTGRPVGRDGAGFKVNNSFRSLLARELVDEHPHLRHYIEMRPLAGERRMRPQERVGV